MPSNRARARPALLTPRARAHSLPLLTSLSLPSKTYEGDGPLGPLNPCSLAPPPPIHQHVARGECRRRSEGCVGCRMPWPFAGLHNTSISPRKLYGPARPSLRLSAGDAQSLGPDPKEQAYSGQPGGGVPEEQQPGGARGAPAVQLESALLYITLSCVPEPPKASTTRAAATCSAAEPRCMRRSVQGQVRGAGRRAGGEWHWRPAPCSAMGRCARASACHPPLTCAGAGSSGGSGGAGGKTSPASAPESGTENRTVQVRGGRLTLQGAARTCKERIAGRRAGVSGLPASPPRAQEGVGSAAGGAEDSGDASAAPESGTRS